MNQSDEQDNDPIRSLQITNHPQVTLDQAIAAWLKDKIGRTRSKETERKYEPTMQSFRAVLEQFGLDLGGDPSLVSVAAQGWAARRTNGGEVSNNTFNQRLAIISSFYEYARKHRFLSGDNPIEMLDRRPVQPYAAAIAMSDTEVKKRMKLINRRTISGMRDHALLSVAFSTGHRVAELQGMRWGHIRLDSNKVIVTFPHCKGGKIAMKELGPETAKSLMGYLHAVYGPELGMLPHDAPIWISFARNSSRGGAISTKAISDICEKWLGTSKVHTTRHTHAVNMEKAGAPITAIAESLLHSNLGTTTKYMHGLHKAENPYAPKLEVLLGIEVSEE